MKSHRKNGEAKPRLGELPPRYHFLLNPHISLRTSRCPTCDKLTFARKFALLIHIDGLGLLTLGLACKYCSKDEMIICHQLDLDTELAQGMSKIKPEVIGNDYLVMGTVEMKVFKASLLIPILPAELLAHIADFRGYKDFNFDPGGWRHQDADPKKFIITSEQAKKNRETPWTTAARQTPIAATTSRPIHPG